MPTTDLVSVSSVGHANHLDIGDVWNLWMLIEERSKFRRVNVLAVAKYIFSMRSTISAWLVGRFCSCLSSVPAQ